MICHNKTIFCSKLSKSNRFKYCFDVLGLTQVRHTSQTPSDVRKDYYEILGIDRHKCNSKDIRNAYLKLCKQHHPDKVGNDEEAKRYFQQINEAYSVLSKASERTAYDYQMNNVHYHRMRRYTNNDYYSRYGYRNDQNYYSRYDADDFRRSYFEEMLRQQEERRRQEAYSGYQGGSRKFSNSTIINFCFLLIFTGLFFRILYYFVFYKNRSDKSLERSKRIGQEYSDRARQMREEWYAEILRRELEEQKRKEMIKSRTCDN